MALDSPPERTAHERKMNMYAATVIQSSAGLYRTTDVLGVWPYRGKVAVACITTLRTRLKPWIQRLHQHPQLIRHHPTTNDQPA
jgi:hypothetical protein